MSIFDFFKKKTKYRAETEVLEDGDIGLNDALMKAFLGVSTQITLNKALEIPTFAGCLSRICNTIASVPFKLYRRKGEDTEEVEDARVNLLNMDTQDTMTGADFKKAMVFDYLTNKGGYAFINRRGSRYISLHYVEPARVAFLENTDPIFKDYKISVNGRQYENYQFIKLVRRTRNGYKGRSIIEDSGDVLNTALLAIKLEAAMYSKGGNKKGFLQSEKNLQQEQINYLREAFSRMYSNDEERAVVLNNGVKFQESSSTAAELQVNENKKSNAIEICKLFNMPPAMLSGGATDSDRKAYVQECIIPILEAFMEALNRDLLLESEKKNMYFAPDLFDLTKGDTKARYEAYEKGLKNGFLQVDDVRKIEHYPAFNLDYIKLGLNDVFYDPDSGYMYTPNMDKAVNLHDLASLAARDEKTGADAPLNNAPEVQQPEGDDTGKEEEDEDNIKS